MIDLREAQRFTEAQLEQKIDAARAEMNDIEQMMVQHANDALPEGARHIATTYVRRQLEHDQYLLDLSRRNNEKKVNPVTQQRVINGLNAIRDIEEEGIYTSIQSCLSDAALAAEQGLVANPTLSSSMKIIAERMKATGPKTLPRLE